MRHGKHIRQRIDALGFQNAEPDERVHDLLDAHEALQAKANNLAMLVKELALGPTELYYERAGNTAPLQLLRMAVEDVDKLTNKGGAR